MSREARSLQEWAEGADGEDPAGPKCCWGRLGQLWARWHELEVESVQIDVRGKWEGGESDRFVGPLFFRLSDPLDRVKMSLMGKLEEAVPDHFIGQLRLSARDRTQQEDIGSFSRVCRFVQGVATVESGNVAAGAVRVIALDAAVKPFFDMMQRQSDTMTRSLGVFMKSAAELVKAARPEPAPTTNNAGVALLNAALEMGKEANKSSGTSQQPGQATPPATPPAKHNYSASLPFDPGESPAPAPVQIEERSMQPGDHDRPRWMNLTRDEVVEWAKANRGDAREVVREVAGI